MDQVQYSNLLAGVHAVPDPRQARGKQVEWTCLWGVIASALLSHHRTPTAIAQWARQQARLVLATVRPARGRVPSASTIRRTLRQVDSGALEQQRAQVGRPPLTPARDTVPPPSLQGQAVDGTSLRGVGAHGRPLELVSRVEHGNGHGLAQTAGAPQQHESRAVPNLLARRDVRGVVVTLDAGLASPKLARQIRHQGGH